MRYLIAILLIFCGVSGMAQVPHQHDTVDSTHLHVTGVDEIQTVWDRANQCYMSGDFKCAAALYQRILDDNGLSSMQLYYNLGNSYFKSGHLGRAILNYERALRLSPSNRDVRHNLKLAQARTVDKIDEVPRFFLNNWVVFISNVMSESVWTFISFVCFGAALVLVLVFLLTKRLKFRKIGFYGALSLFVLFLLTTGFASVQHRLNSHSTKAVVVSSSVAVKSSPELSGTDQFVLNEGTEVEVQTTLGNWYEIEIADGKKGWVGAHSIEII